MKKTIKSKPLHKMNAAEKRVAIAKDVLAQIKCGQYRIKRGCWAEFDEVESPSEMDTSLDQRMLTVGIVIKPPPCSACAIGGAFVSAIRLFNDGEAKVSNEKEGAFEKLEQFFTKKQLVMIENAFEKGDGGCQSDQSLLKTKEIEDSLNFGRRYTDSPSRAEAIFKNIIKNNGQFVP